MNENNSFGPFEPSHLKTILEFLFNRKLVVVLFMQVIVAKTKDFVFQWKFKQTVKKGWEFDKLRGFLVDL